MKLSIMMSLVLSLGWASIAGAQSLNPERPVDLRITGTLLGPEAPKRDDWVTVNITVQGKPLILRIGKVEDLTTPERAQAVKDDVLLKQVRFTGPADLMERLQKPEILGKVIVIQGWLNTKDKRLQVTAVDENSGASSPTKGQ